LIQETISPKWIKLRGHVTSPFKDLERILETVKVSNFS
jgi:hypothetical protein